MKELKIIKKIKIIGIPMKGDKEKIKKDIVQMIKSFFL